MRMINQAMSVLLIALGLRKPVNTARRYNFSTEAIETLLGLDAHLVKQLGDSLLLEKLTFLGKLDIDRLLVLADIYREEAEGVQLAEQPENSLFAAQRSLRLFLNSSAKATINVELIQKIEPLRLMLAAPTLPIETRLALLDYLDRLLSSGDDLLDSAWVFSAKPDGSLFFAPEHRYTIERLLRVNRSTISR